MNVVLYMRYSSDNQTEQSIEGQERVCNEYCQRMGFNIVGKYVDRATSAYKDVKKRVQFIRIIADSERGNFQGIVVYAIDRFSRNKTDHAIYRDKLRRNGVTLYSATETIVGGNESIIVSSVLEGFSEYYSAELSAKVTRGMYESAHKCQFIGGQRPYGYKIVNKKYEIDETESVYVKKIFEKYVNGESATDIVKYLKSIGVKNSNGFDFTVNTILKLLHNIKYKGTYVYKELVIPDGIPRIVSDKLWEDAQDECHRKFQRSKPAEYILTGKLFCRKCGSPMTGTQGTGKSGKRFTYYICNNKKHNKKCDLVNPKKDELETIVLDRINNLLTPEVVERISKAAGEYAKSDDVLLEKQSLENRVLELEREQKNMIKALALAPTKSIADKVAEYDTEIETVKNTLSEYVLTQRIITENDVSDYINLFVQRKIQNVNIDKYLVKMFVKAIYYSEEEIVIIFNLHDPESTDNSDLREIIGCSTTVDNAPPHGVQSNTCYRCSIKYHKFNYYYLLYIRR